MLWKSNEINFTGFNFKRQWKNSCSKAMPCIRRRGGDKYELQRGSACGKALAWMDQIFLNSCLCIVEPRWVVMLGAVPLRWAKKCQLESFGNNPGKGEQWQEEGLAGRLGTDWEMRCRTASAGAGRSQNSLGSHWTKWPSEKFLNTCSFCCCGLAWFGKPGLATACSCFTEMGVREMEGLLSEVIVSVLCPTLFPSCFQLEHAEDDGWVQSSGSVSSSALGTAWGHPTEPEGKPREACRRHSQNAATAAVKGFSESEDDV